MINLDDIENTSKIFTLMVIFVKSFSICRINKLVNMSCIVEVLTKVFIHHMAEKYYIQSIHIFIV